MERNFNTEFIFSAVRSSGPGGQHVNKVSTKAELRFDVNKSLLLNPEEKILVLENLKNKLTKDGLLIITSQETRSLSENKKICISKFYEIIEKALIKPTIRKKVLPSKTWHKNRLEDKKKNAQKKEIRKNINLKEF